MENLYDRTEMLLGSEKTDILKRSAVAVFGLGGVGSYCAEALARAGIGRLLVCDGDVVAPSNLNRQLYALCSTLGKPKALVACERVADINPSCEVNVITEYVTPETDLSFLAGFDYIVDAVDDVPVKLSLAVFCTGHGIKLISAMGCGNRLKPERLYVTDIFKTESDPLARSVRQKLRKAGVKKLKVVASSEPPLSPARAADADNSGQRRCPGSVSFVPSAAGLLLAKEVVCDLCGL